jgi:ATP:corrinoid adenosyltransferase
MINAWTGKTGSGKTLAMVEAAFLHWCRGRTIHSNTILFFYPCDKNGKSKYNIRQRHTITEFPELFSWYEHLKWKMRKKFKYKLDRIPARGAIKYFELIEEIQDAKYALILFDEAQVLFNARHWQALPAEFQYKLQQHRKHGLDLYCTTQNMATIDVTYRRLVHRWIYCEHRVRIWKFKFLLRQLKDVDAIYGNVEELKAPTIEVQRRILTPWTPRLYDTFYDVGFRRFNIVWNTEIKFKDNQQYRVPSLLIYPKTMSMSDASRLRSSLGRKSSRGISESSNED